MNLILIDDDLLVTTALKIILEARSGAPRHCDRHLRCGGNYAL